MATKDDDQPLIKEGREEDNPASRFQLELAASVITSIIDKNAGSGASEAFWDDDSFDFEDDVERDTDPDCWDPEDETLPEMDPINHNIFECD
jgi:hypothetical protein